MKKILFTILLLSGFAHADDIKNSRVLLLSYPRSGNTWTRYSIEYLTKRPTCISACFIEGAKVPPLNFPIGNTYDIGIDNDREPVIKTHRLGLKVNPDEDYLILVIRNFKECIFRENHTKRKSLALLEKPNNRYYQNIRDFDRWPEDRRLLIYYEDLITNPVKEYKKLTSFFTEGSERIEAFINEYDLHRQNCIAYYQRFSGKSTTKGKKKLHHSKKFFPCELAKMDQLAKKHLGELYDKYLIHYSE